MSLGYSGGFDLDKTRVYESGYWKRPGDMHLFQRKRRVFSGAGLGSVPRRGTPEFSHTRQVKRGGTLFL